MLVSCCVVPLWLLSLNPFTEFRIWNNSSSSDVLYIQASISPTVVGMQLMPTCITYNIGGESESIVLFTKAGKCRITGISGANV